MDPRAKLFLTVAYMAMVYYVETALSYLLLTLFLLMAAKVAGKPPKQMLQGISIILCLAFVATVANIFFVTGTPLAENGIFSHITEEGLLLSFRMFLKLALLVGCSSLLAFTTSPFSLSKALEQILKPFKRMGFPVQGFAMILGISIKLIPVVFDEARRIIQAQSMRSPEFISGNLLQRTRYSLMLIVPLFFCVAQRGENLALAMESRCYGAVSSRTSMQPLAFSSADLAGVGLAGLFLCLLLALELANSL